MELTNTKVDSVSTSDNVTDGAVEVVLMDTKKRKAKTPGKALVPKQENATSEIMPLTAAEQERYDELKTEVRANYKLCYETSVALGKCLLEIKDELLYREEHDSWQQFLDAEFGGLTQNKVSRDIQVARLEERFKEANVPPDCRPDSEGQARELLHVYTSKLQQAVINARELARGGTVTAKHFRLAATEFKPVVAKSSMSTKAKIEASKPSRDIEPLDLDYNEVTGQLILAYGSDENTIEMISLADLIRRAGVPESAIREALDACFGPANTPEVAVVEPAEALAA